MPYSDRQKQLEYKRQWNKEFYFKNSDAEKRRIQARKKEIAKWLGEFKSRLSCKVCGESTTVCLDFHHLDREKKEFNIGFAKNWGWGIERIKREIEKCIILCANCHRKVHAGLLK